MEANVVDASPRAGAGPGTAEIDLYGELKTFVKLSPSGQLRYLQGPNRVAMNEPHSETKRCEAQVATPELDPLEVKPDRADFGERKLCPSCGNASEASELFCPACGSFLNGNSSPAAIERACADCNQSIGAEEIFCPWCGAVQSAD